MTTSDFGWKSLVGRGHKDIHKHTHTNTTHTQHTATKQTHKYRIHNSPPNALIGILSSTELYVRPTQPFAKILHLVARQRPLRTTDARRRASETCAQIFGTRCCSAAACGCVCVCCRCDTHTHTNPREEQTLISGKRISWAWATKWGTACVTARADRT